MALHGSTRSVPAPLPSVHTRTLFEGSLFSDFPSFLGQLIFAHFSKSPPFLLHQYKSKISPNKIRWIKRAYAYRLDYIAILLRTGILLYIEKGICTDWHVTKINRLANCSFSMKHRWSRHALLIFIMWNDKPFLPLHYLVLWKQFVAIHVWSVQRLVRASVNII